MSKTTKPLTILSLFDGMSCGQIALRDMGVPINRYYASEIDKHAIKQTQLNFPETIQLGDVERWREWDIDWSSIDLLLAGSPCQGFSLAGKMLGHDDPRSRLYWVFLDILGHIQTYNPNVKFLLENVRMRPNDERQINESLGLMPVVINSSLVSAQNRVRLYWSNIRTRQEGLFGDVHTDIPMPEDRGIFIQDILESEVEDKYYIDSGVFGQDVSGKARALRVGGGLSTDARHSWQENNMICAMPGRGSNNEQRVEERKDMKSNALTSVCKDNLVLGTVLEVGSLRFFGETEFRTMKIMKSPCLNAQSREDGNNQTVVELAVGTWRTHKVDGGFREMAGDRSPCIPARARNDGSGQPCVRTDRVLRRLTPSECARLQTIPEWYKWECSDTQAYKMLGNGWTVEVIKHILSFLDN
jgi:DNA (cytosine-5-)-methyltransferase|nr:MAG TPA: Cytosine specific methyltransferase [Caudoviricetes sp.]